MTVRGPQSIASHLIEKLQTIFRRTTICVVDRYDGRLARSMIGTPPKFAETPNRKSGDHGATMLRACSSSHDPAADLLKRTCDEAGAARCPRRSEMGAATGARPPSGRA